MTTVEYLDLELLKHFIPKRATSGIVLEQGYLLYYGDIMVVTEVNMEHFWDGDKTWWQV